MEISSEFLPTQWQVILKDGSVIGVWADAHSEADGCHIFQIWARATRGERESPDLIITGQHPTQLERISFIVAKIPIELVANIWTRSWDTPITPEDLTPTEWARRPQGFAGPVEEDLKDKLQ